MQCNASQSATSHTRALTCMSFASAIMTNEGMASQRAPLHDDSTLSKSIDLHMREYAKQSLLHHAHCSRTPNIPSLPLRLLSGSKFRHDLPHTEVPRHCNNDHFRGTQSGPLHTTVNRRWWPNLPSSNASCESPHAGTRNLL